MRIAQRHAVDRRRLRGWTVRFVRRTVRRLLFAVTPGNRRTPPRPAQEVILCVSRESDVRSAVAIVRITGTRARIRHEFIGYTHNRSIHTSAYLYYYYVTLDRCATFSFPRRESPHYYAYISYYYNIVWAQRELRVPGIRLMSGEHMCYYNDNIPAAASVHHLIIIVTRFLSADCNVPGRRHDRRNSVERIALYDSTVLNRCILVVA